MEEGTGMNFWQTIGIALLATVLTWVGHGLVAAYQRQNEKDRALEAEKRDTYKRFMTLLFDMFRHSKSITAKKGLSSDLENRFFEVARDMTVNASDDVLDLWIRFKNMGDNPKGDYILSLVGELMVAVRTDLGHTSSRYGSRDLLSTFITDIDSVELPSVR